MMKIVDVQTTVLRQPDVQPIADGIQDLLVIEILTDEDITGIGEVHTSPLVAQSIIHAPVSHVNSRGLKGILVGRDPFEREVLWREMYQQTSVYGRRGVVIHAMSGIDIALWDIVGKALGVPVHRLLGGGYHKEVKAYASILMPNTLEAVQQDVRRCVKAGFQAVKLGWGPLGEGIDYDIELAQAAREIAGDELDIMIDIGYGLEIKMAIALAKRLERYDVFFLEEALSPDNLRGLAKLTASTSIPIASGEKETTFWGFRDLIQTGRIDIIQPDVARAGGITECKKIADYAQKQGVMCIPHCWSSDILLAATLQLVACIPSIPYVEYCTLKTPLRTSVTCQQIRVEGGKVDIPTGPGLGIELNRDTLERYRYQP